MTFFGKFLDRHYNIARLIITAKEIIFNIRNGIKSGKLKDELIKRSKEIFRDVAPYVIPIYEVLKLMVTAAIYASRWKFTTLALRTLSKKGGVLVNLIGVGIGIALDLILGGFSGGKQDKDKKEKLTDLVFNSKVKNSLKFTVDFSNRRDAIGIIRRHYSGQDQEKVLKEYTKLTDNLEDEESKINDAAYVLSYLEHLGGGGLKTYMSY